MSDNSGKGLRPGSKHYRAFVGWPEAYDIVSAMQFNLLTQLGLREHHSLLDIGCGSLRAGRLFMPYLMPDRYFGMEPNNWLIEDGVKHEIGQDMVGLKRPRFSNDADFTLSEFGQKFDFIVAQSIFSHAAPAQVERCLGEARKVMSPTSIFAATFVKGTENYTGSAWVYPGCVQYTLDYMKDIANQHGLACIPIGWKHPNNQSWVVITDPSNAKCANVR